MASILSLGISIASPAAAELAFSMPEECGSQPEFWRGVERLVGTDAARVRVSAVEITKTDDVYVLHLQLDDESRELTHWNCHTLFRSAVVMVAASARPELKDENPAESGLGPTEEAAQPLQSSPTDRVSSPHESPSTRPSQMVRVAAGAPWKSAVGGGGGVAYGLVPDLAPQLELYGVAVLGHWGGALAVQYLLPGSTGHDGRDVEVQALGGRLAGVFQPTSTFRVSVGLEVDWLRGEGASELGTTRTDSTWSVAPFAELAVMPWRLQHFHVELAFQGRAHVVRPQFVITGFGEVYQTPPAGGSALLRGVFDFL